MQIAQDMDAGRKEQDKLRVAPKLLFLMIEKKKQRYAHYVTQDSESMCEHPVCTLS